MSLDTFQGQVVIVTGASSGIGRAAALLLASRSARVVLAGRRKELLEQVAQDCRQVGGEAKVVLTDVKIEEQCRELVKKTIRDFGKLDMLVNNAGLTMGALLQDLPDLDMFRHIMEVNFFGAVYCTTYALPHLKQSAGRILVVSSLGGKAPLPGNTPYTSSKFALHGFFDSLRMEVKRYGVSVTIICPYWVVSGFHEAMLDRNGVPRGPAGRAIYTKKTMTSERCAEIALQAAASRKREVLMGPGRLMVWMKLLVPGLLDRMVVKNLRAAIHRSRRR